jgi:TorA maturation chaperone TorD
MESAMINTALNEWLGLADNRSDCYALLASLLMQPPSEDTLAILQNLHWQEATPAKVASALRDLCRVAGDYQPAALAAEFNKLFVGLGCGEVIPYASWYREKRIQSLSLASLRADLHHLGIARQSDCHESEDHAGALCETMSIICRESGNVPRVTQAQFFRRHIAPWMHDFFRDLLKANSVRFYQTVSLFGGRFLEGESEYLEYGAHVRFTKKEGGMQNENGIFQDPADIY